MHFKDINKLYANRNVPSTTYWPPQPTDDDCCVRGWGVKLGLTSSRYNNGTPVPYCLCTNLHTSLPPATSPQYRSRGLPTTAVSADRHESLIVSIQRERERERRTHDLLRHYSLKKPRSWANTVWDHSPELWRQMSKPQPKNCKWNEGTILQFIFLFV